MNVTLWQWHSSCHLVVSFLCHMTFVIFPLDNIYFRIVFRIGKRIWVKMKFFNVCCLMLTMLNNGWQKENWLLRDQSRLEIIPLKSGPRTGRRNSDQLIHLNRSRILVRSQFFVRATMTADWYSQEPLQDQNYDSQKLTELRMDQFSRSVIGPAREYPFFKVRNGPTFFYFGPLFRTTAPISGTVIWFGQMIRD